MITPDEFHDVALAMISGSISAFHSNKGLADKAISQLSDDKLHVALDANTNSIALIMKHVAGNLISQILEGDHWNTITIHRSGSSNFNQRIRGPGITRHRHLQKNNGGRDVDPNAMRDHGMY